MSKKSTLTPEEISIRKGWSRGLTKGTHPGLRKISETMKARKINNFKRWQENHPVYYAPFPHTPEVAELIGAVLGDGHIEKFPRTERLTLTGDAKKIDFVFRYVDLVEKLFQKLPEIEVSRNSNAARLSIYQKFISERLGVPTGNRRGFPYKLPEWIDESEECLISFLRGLFEAEGYLSIHLPTCTYNFGFVNYNKHLLDIVENALRRLEFHPEVRHNAIRIRKRAEVQRLKELLHFREY